MLFMLYRCPVWRYWWLHVQFLHGGCYAGNGRCYLYPAQTYLYLVQQQTATIQQHRHRRHYHYSRAGQETTDAQRGQWQQRWWRENKQTNQIVAAQNVCSCCSTLVVRWSKFKKYQTWNSVESTEAVYTKLLYSSRYFCTGKKTTVKLKSETKFSAIWDSLSVYYIVDVTCMEVCFIIINYI